MGQYSLREMVRLSDDPDGVMRVLESANGPMPFFKFLSKGEQDDVLDGRCVYRQHEHQVILDYTQTWGVPTPTLDMGRQITPNQAGS